MRQVKSGTRYRGASACVGSCSWTSVMGLFESSNNPFSVSEAEA
jgi:hypothetical protein